MPLIQRNFLLWPKLWISSQLFLGKILAYISKSFGNVRDLRIGPPWNCYFLRYHQSPPLFHILSLASNGSDCNEFFWTWTKLQYTLKQSRENPQPNYFGAWWDKEEAKKPLHWSNVQPCIEVYLKMGHCTMLTVLCWHSRMRNGNLEEEGDRNQNEFSDGEWERSDIVWEWGTSVRTQARNKKRANAMFAKVIWEISKQKIILDMLLQS